MLSKKLAEQISSGSPLPSLPPASMSSGDTFKACSESPLRANAVARNEVSLRRESPSMFEAAVDYYVHMGWPRDEAAQLLAEASARKRARVGADDRGHVPSDLTLWHVWYKYQTDPPGPRFRCHRPISARPPIPLLLLYRPFMKFVDDLKVLPSKEDVAFAWKYWKAVHSPLYVEKHAEMVEAIALSMSSYFGLEVAVSVEHKVEGRVAVDVSFTKGIFPALSSVFKAQPASGDPAFQNMDYARRLWCYEPKLTINNHPYMLLMNVTGPQVEVMAASVEENGKVVWAETLTSFSCYAKATGCFSEVEASARVWRALRLFLVDYVPAPKRERPVPWPLEAYNDVQQPDEGSLFFTYREEAGGNKKCAKFCKTYSSEAHQAWGDAAPSLESCSEVKLSMDKESNAATYFLMMKMQYLSREDGWLPAAEVVRAAEDNGPLLEKLRKRLEEALAVGHGKEFVHGDFRLANLLLKGIGVHTVDGLFQDYQVRVIDFEWSGKAGAARFPVQPNPQVQWYNAAGYGEEITKEHDTWFLGRLVEQLTACKDSSIRLRTPESSV